MKTRIRKGKMPNRRENAMDGFASTSRLIVKIQFEIFLFQKLLYHGLRIARYPAFVGFQKWPEINSETHKERRKASKVAPNTKRDSARSPSTMEISAKATL